MSTSNLTGLIRTANCFRRLQITMALSVCVLVCSSTSADDTLRKGQLIVGVDANYSLAMENDGAKWNWNGIESDLFAGLAQQGITDLRVRLWTRDDGTNGKDYATNVVKRSLRAGLNPYLVLFLSEDWADLMKQPVPAAWKELSFEDRAEAIQDYSRDIVAHFRREGLRNHLYEIGNEIDYGICGEYPGKSSKKNAEALRKRIWPRTAKLILASQAGVRQSDPEAKFMLHISHWWDAEFCIAFFQFMIDQGVQVDYAGLSYFPTSNIGGSLQLDQFATAVTEISNSIHRPIIVPETAYPSTKDFKGQFSRWKFEVLGYPLSPLGQQQWLEDFLFMCNHHPKVHAVYYWSPEWYGDGMWKGFALFETNGGSKPAWSAFREGLNQKVFAKELLYFELDADLLFRVPVTQAQRLIKPVLKKLVEQFGGMNADYIKSLDLIELDVDAYRVELRGALMNNLHLKLHDRASSQRLDLRVDLNDKLLRHFLTGVDPNSQRLVIITRSDSTESAETLVTKMRELGYDINLHPKPDDLPLKFGLIK